MSVLGRASVLFSATVWTSSAFLRRLRTIAPFRKLFFSLTRSYASTWDAFALLPGLAREAVLADKGDPGRQGEFWESGRAEADRFLLPVLKPTATALELGPGVGRVARWVAPHCRHLVLVDVSRGMLRRARANLSQFSNVRYVATAGNNLAAIDSRSIDLVYSFLVLQHIEREDVIRYFAEISRILRPNGRLIFQLPNLVDPQQLTQYMSYSLTVSDRSVARVRYYTREEVEILLKRFGFTPEQWFTSESFLVIARLDPA
jgi:ubiquinone/menaquinone biosynthesis C-methylase UbiE